MHSQSSDVKIAKSKFNTSFVRVGVSHPTRNKTKNIKKCGRTLPHQRNFLIKR